MKTLYFEPPPPSLSLLYALSLSLNRIRARRRRSLRRVFLFRGEKNGAKTVLKTRDEEATRTKKVLSLSLFCSFSFVSRNGAFIHSLHFIFRLFNSLWRWRTRERHNKTHPPIPNWKTALDTQITERDIERERYTHDTHVVVLLRLLFCFFCCVFLRGGTNEDDDERRRRTTTTSKEDDEDEVDEQENGKDTSLKLRDDDEFIETRQNEDE